MRSARRASKKTYGAGKSTLLRINAGLEIPDIGQVRIDGTDVTRLPAANDALVRIPALRRVHLHDRLGQHASRRDKGLYPGGIGFRHPQA